MIHTVRTITLGLLAALLAMSAHGCSIQEVFRSTLGGVNSDQATLNKYNASNDQSFAHDDNQTRWNWPSSED